MNVRNVRGDGAEGDRERVVTLGGSNRGVFYFFYFAGKGGATNARRHDRPRDGTRMHGHIGSQPGGCRKMVFRDFANVSFRPIADAASPDMVEVRRQQMQLEFMADEPVGDGQLFIYLDEHGADQLLRVIEAARRSGHEHLLTEEWGGTGLTISSGSTRSFNKVTITFEAIR